MSGQDRAFPVRVLVRLRPSVYDPQGETIRRALASVGGLRVGAVRQGKMFELEIAAVDEADAGRRAREIARRVLANPVLEDFTVEVLSG